jgi:hypothetical protein
MGADKSLLEKAGKTRVRRKQFQKKAAAYCEQAAA